jgi:myo-inositol-1-phosphate synthase
VSGRNIGIWLIGAWGRVGTALAVVLAGLQSRSIAPDRFVTDGLVTEQPEFAPLALADWTSFVVGGHEIRKTSAAVEARNLFAGARSISDDLLNAIGPSLAAWDRNVRTGTLLNAGPQAESLASAATLKTRGERPATALRRIAVDLDEFRTTAHLDAVIVINVASSEPIASPGSRGLSAQELLQLLEHADRSPVPASVLYAVAALQSGCSYLNFTPSFGSDIPALKELALQTGSLHMGRDGRTDLAAIGLLNSPAPAEDGPRRDLLRAARALLDLSRLCEREQRRGQAGLLAPLACFFERPMGDVPVDTPSQVRLLREWVDRVSAESC